MGLCDLGIQAPLPTTSRLWSCLSQASWTAWTHQPTQTRDSPSQQETKRDPKTPKDTENNCHHTKHKSAIPSQSLRSTVRLVMGWANMPTQHETPSQRGRSLLSCQKAGQAQLHTKLNEISFLVLLSSISWPMLNYLKPSFINLPQLFFTQPLASHLTTLNGLHWLHPHEVRGTSHYSATASEIFQHTKVVCWTVRALDLPSLLMGGLI